MFWYFAVRQILTVEGEIFDIFCHFVDCGWHVMAFVVIWTFAGVMLWHSWLFGHLRVQFYGICGYLGICGCNVMAFVIFGKFEHFWALHPGSTWLLLFSFDYLQMLMNVDLILTIVIIMPRVWIRLVITSVNVTRVWLGMELFAEVSCINSTN